MLLSTQQAVARIPSAARAAFRKQIKDRGVRSEDAAELQVRPKPRGFRVRKQYSSGRGGVWKVAERFQGFYGKPLQLLCRGLLACGCRGLVHQVPRRWEFHCSLADCQGVGLSGRLIVLASHSLARASLWPAFNGAAK